MISLDKETSKTIVSLVLAAAMTTGALSGCNSNSNSKKSLLEGTILENSRVIIFEDGHIDIATEINDDYDRFVGSSNHKHNHYKSIITNEIFSSTECTFSIDYKYEITSDESIVSYLTPEELAKASTEGLTSDDIKTIIIRIFSEHNELEQGPTR